jgi:hypothetical protein
MNSTTAERTEPTSAFAAEMAADEARRGFLLAALQHDAVDGAVTELLFEHVVQGLHDRAVVADSLPPLLEELAEVPGEDDWKATALHISDPDESVIDPADSVRSAQGNVFAVGLIRGFLRAVVDEPYFAERLRARPEIVARGEHLASRSAAIEEEVGEALRSGTEEDWNIIAGQLIREARDVTGPAAEGARD